MEVEGLGDWQKGGQRSHFIHVSFVPNKILEVDEHWCHLHDKWTRPAPSVLAYCKRSRTGPWEALGIELRWSSPPKSACTGENSCKILPPSLPPSLPHSRLPACLPVKFIFCMYHRMNSVLFTLFVWTADKQTAVSTWEALKYAIKNTMYAKPSSCIQLTILSQAFPLPCISLT